MERHKVNIHQNRQEENITNEKISNKKRKEGFCNICQLAFKRYYNYKKHQERCHIIKGSSGSFMMTDNTLARFKTKSGSARKQFICYYCSVLKNFKSKYSLQRHKMIIHKNMSNIIETRELYMKLSEDEIYNLENRTLRCLYCDQKFSCVQDQEAHLINIHNWEKKFRCNICSKSFVKTAYLANHKNSVHKGRLFVCSICDVSFKMKHHLKTHIVAHKHKEANKSKQKYSVRHCRRIAKSDTNKIQQFLNSNDLEVRKSILKELIQNNLDVIQHMNTNPLTEEDIVQMIQDYNLTDKTMINVLQKLSKKWGRENVMTKDIQRKLVKRKKLTDQFFSKIWLDKNTDTHFISNQGESVGRWIVYCHDIPGLIAFQNLMEENENTEDKFNVIGADDGKGFLKLIFNSSIRKIDKGENKILSPKRSLILAAVSNVKESYHNMNILFKLTNLNEVEYKLSQDLKLTSIVIGITSHSSKYPCPYGECCKDDEGNWIKGQDRTIKNLTDNQKKWCANSKGTKNDKQNLKKYKNCNFLPLITSAEETPILYLIPPPPLHTLLLSPVNDVMKKLQSLYPNVVQILDNLHIQRSQYHGRNFEGKLI